MERTSVTELTDGRCQDDFWYSDLFFFILLTGLLISVVCLNTVPCSSDGGFDHRACVYAGISCVMRYHTTVEIECKNPWQKRLYEDDCLIGGK